MPISAARRRRETSRGQDTGQGAGPGDGSPCRCAAHLLSLSPSAARGATVAYTAQCMLTLPSSPLRNLSTLLLRAAFNLVPDARARDRDRRRAVSCGKD